MTITVEKTEQCYVKNAQECIHPQENLQRFTGLHPNQDVMCVMHKCTLCGSIIIAGQRCESCHG